MTICINREKWIEESYLRDFRAGTHWCSFQVLTLKEEEKEEVELEERWKKEERRKEDGNLVVH